MKRRDLTGMYYRIRNSRGRYWDGESFGPVVFAASGILSAAREWLLDARRKDRTSSVVLVRVYRVQS